MSRNGSRRRYTAKEKVKILEEGRQSGAVSETCRRHGISTAQFYQWEKQAREAMLERFQEGKRKGRHRDRKVESLEEENTRLKAVIAEITAENLEMKKNFIR
jgi:putative transposase